MASTSGNYHHRRQMPKHNTGHPTREAYELLDEIQSAEALRNRNKVFAVDYTLKLGPYSLASHPGEVPLALGSPSGRNAALPAATGGRRLAGSRESRPLAKGHLGPPAQRAKRRRFPGRRLQWESAENGPVRRSRFGSRVTGGTPLRRAGFPALSRLNEVHLQIAARAPHADAPVTLEGVELSGPLPLRDVP